ncbi:MAG: FAD binding domain-containing protein [Syntrophobacterales bacterium]|jgi:4-hydroxybenzoyl-CoA reductase subunit beta|nr:FAD binding domain-containing protein [Syntrophobacterales bacterium]
MIREKITVLRPESLGEALKMMADMPQAKPLAGGTDLLVQLKQGLITGACLIDLDGIPGFAGIDREGDHFLIGAGVRLEQLSRHSLVKRYFPALTDAALSVASPNLRNMGTIGGNICLEPRCLYLNKSQFWRSSQGNCLKTGGSVCFAVPKGGHCYACFSADCPPALMVLDASVVISQWHGGQIKERIVSLADLYADDGQRHLLLNPGELVTAIRIPVTAGYRSAYRKYRHRKSIDFPLAGVAVGLLWEGGVISNVRIAIGAMASAPLWAREAMTILEGKTYSGDILREAAERITSGTRAVRNQDDSPSQRRHMIRVLFQRIVRDLVIENVTPVSPTRK